MIVREYIPAGTGKLKSDASEIPYKPWFPVISQSAYQAFLGIWD
jgi:hypothetical protein